MNEQLVNLGEILESGGHPRDGGGATHELHGARGGARHSYQNKNWFRNSQNEHLICIEMKPCNGVKRSNLKIIEVLMFSIKTPCDIPHLG